MTTSSPTRSESNAHNPWRVILVGRTGLDQSLRRDADIELIRTRETIEAIGELGDPIDHESPAQAVVIVSPDALEDEQAEERKGKCRGVVAGLGHGATVSKMGMSPKPFAPGSYHGRIGCAARSS